MKRRFTILTAALALLAFLALPMGMMGQTRESYNVTYDVTDLGDMFENGSSYASANGYWKVPASAGGSALISIPITEQPTSNISLTFHIATFGTGTNPDASNTTITAVGTESNSNWSGSGVSSYPSSSTYVDGVMTITMPENPTTLSGLEITMGVNSSVKIFRLQSITVSYTYGGGTPTPTTYTVTYDCNGGTSDCPENVTDLEAGDEITLADGPVKTGYDFAGWSDGNTTYDEGDTYTVNGNVTFTAQWTEQVSGDVHWVLTDLADLTTSDVFVIVGNNGSNFAMKNSGATNSGPVVVAVTVSGNELTGTIGDDIRWNISGDATNGYIFYPNGSSTTWLYCIDNNNGLRIGSGNTNYNTFKIQDDYIYNTGRQRYVGIYSSQDWRSYTSINNNIKNQTFAFYKKVTGSLPPSITANNVNIAYNATSGEIEYTLNNPVATATLIANTNDSWLTLGTVGSTSVPFTCSTNTETTARTATVTLVYVNGEATLVTKEVTVTQGAAPISYTTIPDLFAAATSTETPVYVTFNDWVVSGISTNGKNVFVTDNDGNGFVIYGTNMSDIYTVGDILSGTAVSCTLKKYNGFAELLNVVATDLTITTGGTITVANVDMADLAGVNTGALVHYEGLTCNITTNTAGTTTYYNYNLSDGTTTLQVYNSLYAFDALVEGKTYNITGVYQQYNNTKEILPRSADDIEEVEVQHEEYTLTVTPSANVEIFTFVSDDPTEEGHAGEFTAQVYDGTTVGISVSATTGYVLESVVVDNVNVILQLDETGWYEFTMPTHDVTVTATAVEDVAPAGGNYVRITSLDQLTDGSKVIIAARHDEDHTQGYYAMPGETSGKPNGVAFTSETSGNDEILPATITASEDSYYWTVNVTEDGYTFTNAENQMIGYTSGTNFATGNNTEWTISIGTAAGSAMVGGYTGFVIRNGNTNTRAFAFNGTAFGAYATSNMTAPGYNFFLDFFVQQEPIEPETYPLTITGYTDDDTKDGYHLIASPVTVDPSTVGMTTGDFDLYYFDEGEDEEWRNWEDNGEGGHFSLVPGKGYLYAKKATTETPSYSFELTGIPYAENGTISLDYTENAECAGFNLIGNPFGTNANLDLPFYRLNQDGSALNTSTESNEINVMEGVFVQATAATREANFTQATGTKRISQLNVKVTRNRSAVLDNAIIRFDDGATLGKFQLNPDDTKVYITEGNQDFAVVRSNNEGEMLVSFKAAENGSYTLSVNAENVEMNYLHLIDNMTGADIDLLSTPNYTFEAKTTDYASRFKLVFATGDNSNSNSFAFFSNGNLVINNEGNATLQVVDVTGRIVRNETINGNASIDMNTANGVYMLRLVNGENVKVQKVVVR